MDDPVLDGGHHEAALRGLSRLNYLSGSARTLWPPLAALARQLGRRQLRVLDVASGGGDVPVRLWRKARRAGLHLEIHGVDVSPRAVEFAAGQAAAEQAAINFSVLDVLADPLPRGFDAVTCSLFLHHLAEEQGVLLLQAMAEATEHLVLVNGLRLVQAFIEADPTAQVLLCAVELCSLHYQYGATPDQLVANALFADGAAALVAVAAEETDDLWQIAATTSVLLPDCEDAMTWRIGNHGFEMTLSARVPELVARHVRPWLEAWLTTEGLFLPDIGSWAIHPGGSRIVERVAAALDLPASATAASAEILAEHGNRSSPSVLFVLDRLRQANARRPRVALAFGPGLVAEAALLV